jgi:hypothetical protein
VEKIIILFIVLVLSLVDILIAACILGFREDEQLVSDASYLEITDFDGRVEDTNLNTNIDRVVSMVVK